MIYNKQKIQLLSAEQYRKLLLNKKPEKALDISLEIRKFEISLYWERAKYFWAFSVTILAALVFIFQKKLDELTNFHLIFAHLLFSLIIIVSYAWYLVNRGSKYWQENWEEHVLLIEEDVVGPLYGGFLIKNKSFSCIERLIDGAPFSVSKINMYISLIMTVFWFISFLLVSLWPLCMNEKLSKGNISTKWLGVSSVIFLILIIFCCILLNKYGRFKFFNYAYKDTNNAKMVKFGVVNSGFSIIYNTK